MATLLIDQIKTKSYGGYDVVITGIDPLHHDCLIGTINTPGMGLIDGQWDLSGYLRSGTENTNLNMAADELQELIALAEHLSAK